MLTNTMEFPGKRPLCLFLVLLLLVLQLFGGVGGASVTWGHVNKYASTLYTEDIYLSHNTTRDVVYGSEKSDGYTITALHAEDLTPLDNGNDGSDPELVRGGIGHPFAVVRFHRQGNLSAALTSHFQLAIYGLDL